VEIEAVPNTLAIALGVAALGMSLSVYGPLARRLWIFGGRVRVSAFGIPDLFLCSFFVIWFAGVIAQGMQSPEREVSIDGLIHGAMIFCGIVALLAGFLKWRGISLSDQLGIDQVEWWRVPLFAFGLLLAAGPVVIAAGALVQALRGADLQRQGIVNFFVEAARSGNHPAVLLTVLMGGIVAPVAEEFLFRGYIYGVVKRFFGWSTALVVTSLLFAAIHMNLASLLPLFILAIALTIAYEVTGSILVNMCMHSVFNLVMFYFLWQSAQGIS
jgi:membrane protease YdiL (CAAX protease family)